MGKDLGFRGLGVTGFEGYGTGFRARALCVFDCLLIALASA